MKDEFGNDITADDMLEGMLSDLETVFWPTLNEDSSLDDDQQAEVTKKIEEAEEAIREARKIIGVSSETE